MRLYEETLKLQIEGRRLLAERKAGIDCRDDAALYASNVLAVALLPIDDNADALAGLLLIRRMANAVALLASESDLVADISARMVAALNGQIARLEADLDVSREELGLADDFDRILQ